jgi:DNA-binding transcriptional LysR family regulator
MIIVPILGGVFLVVLIAGGIRLLILRGQTTVRRGREVAQELFEERMARGVRYSGTHELASKAHVIGTGIALERHVSISYGEMKAAWRDRRWGELVPSLMVCSGILGVVFCGALTIIFMTPWRLIGIIFMGFALVGTFQALRSFWQAEPTAPKEPADSDQ